MLSQDFKEFIQSLNDNHVRYLVIGGYVVAFHGHPCYTKDLDVWIDLSLENAERMVAALAQFGFALLGIERRLQHYKHLIPRDSNKTASNHAYALKLSEQKNIFSTR